jgi:probable rRNA maturation factor
MVTESEGAGCIRRGRSLLSRVPALGRRPTLTLSNRQYVRRVDLRLLRQIVRCLLRKTWPGGSFDLAVHVLATPEMTRLNETCLRHKGPTDVITFDYSEKAGRAARRQGHAARAAPRLRSPALHAPGQASQQAGPLLLHGEVFVCIDEAVSQARRFHATWQSELVRYVAHGLLHLLGYDDVNARARRKMKAAEDTLVRDLAQQFDFSRLSQRG